MREAVIVSTARTPIGKAYRGAFNDTDAPTLMSFAIREAIARAKVDPEEIDDVIVGAALQQGTQGFNIARQSVITSGLPVSVPGQSVDRQCSSSLMSVSTAARVDPVGTVTMRSGFRLTIASIFGLIHPPILGRDFASSG